MSLILTWENPPEVASGLVRSANLWRGDAPIQTDVTWGTAEDPENDDPAARYQVIYTSRGGSAAVVVQDDDIRRYVRPPRACQIEFALVRPDGSPDSGRQIEFRGDGFSRRLLTNTSGKAALHLLTGARLWIHVDGRSAALDCMIPDQQSLTFKSLLAFGSLIDADRHG